MRAVAELEGELGEIVGRARRVGMATGKRSGRRLPIFSSVRGRRRYRILARPVTGNRHAIVAITPQLVEGPAAVVEEPAQTADEPPPDAANEPPPPQDGDEPDREDPVPRHWFTNPNLQLPTAANPAVTITWSGPFDLDDRTSLSRFTAPALYILEDDTPGRQGTPVYVGTAEKVAKRMGEHLLALRKKTRPFTAAMLGKVAPNLQKVKVRIGTVKITPIRVFETLEHVIVRTIQPDHVKDRKLLNERPLARFKAVDRIAVNGIVPGGPRYPARKDVNLAPGDRYELDLP